MTFLLILFTFLKIAAVFSSPVWVSEHSDFYKLVCVFCNLKNTKRNHAVQQEERERGRKEDRDWSLGIGAVEEKEKRKGEAERKRQDLPKHYCFQNRQKNTNPITLHPQFKYFTGSLFLDLSLA